MSDDTNCATIITEQPVSKTVQTSRARDLEILKRTLRDSAANEVLKLLYPKKVV